MIGFLGVLILVAAFAALNLENRSDVSLGFHTFRSVPVFLSGLVSFILGGLVMLPLALRPPRRSPRGRWRHRGATAADAGDGGQADSSEAPGAAPVAAPPSEETITDDAGGAVAATGDATIGDAATGDARVDDSAAGDAAIGDAAGGVATRRRRSRRRSKATPADQPAADSQAAPATAPAPEPTPGAEDEAAAQ